MLQANRKSREVFRDRSLNTDLSEFSKASGGKGVEVLFADFCAQDSGQRQLGNHSFLSANTRHSRSQIIAAMREA